MVKKVYEVTCEGVVQRMIMVEAHNVVEASRLGIREFAFQIGAKEKEVGVVDIYTEPVTLKEVEK
jgi:hypothetical protein